MTMQTAFRKVGEVINAEIVKQVEQQGHHMTGAFEASLEVVTDNNSVSGLGEKYGIYLNLGVKASEIKHPFARARIQGLTRFAQIRMGVNEKEATSIAYAIATAHARDGMPTQGSYRYSKNGKRTDMVEDAIEVVEPDIIGILFEEFTNVIDVHTKVTGR